MGGVLARLGAQAPRSLMVPTADNPRGYFESSELMKLHDQLLRSAGSRWNDWGLFNPEWVESHVAANFQEQLKSVLEAEFGTSRLFLVKDPRISRFLPFWLRTLAEMQIAPKVVIPLRHPLAVARSLEARDHFGRAKSLLLWLRHMLDAEAASRGLERTFVRFDDLLLDWKGQARKIARDLALKWPRMSGDTEADIEQFLSSELRHHVVERDALPESSDALRWTADAYAALNQLVDASVDETVPTDALDRIRFEFDRSSSVYAPVVREHELRVEGLYAGAKAQLAERVAQNEKLQAEHRQLQDQFEASKRELLASQDAREALREEREHALEALAAGAEAHESERLALAEGHRRELDEARAMLQASEARQAALAEEHTLARATWEAEVARRDAETASMAATHRTEADQWTARLAEQDVVHARIVETLRGELDAASSHILEQEAAHARLVQEHQAERERAAQQTVALDAARAELASMGADLAEARASVESRFGEIAKLTRLVLDLEKASADREVELADKEAALAEATRALEGSADERRTETDTATRNLALAEYRLALALDLHARLQREVDALRQLATHQRKALEEVASNRAWRLTAPFHARLDPGPALEPAPDHETAHQWHLLQHSDLFDRDWYLATYPDARASGMDPVGHYLRHGAAAGYNPGPRFDTASYLASFPDLRRSAMNPLAHYIAHGLEEGRTIFPARNA